MVMLCWIVDIRLIDFGVWGRIDGTVSVSTKGYIFDGTGPYFFMY